MDGCNLADGECGAVNLRFLNGECLMTVIWSRQFDAMQLKAPWSRGKIGMASIPGSNQVLDRATGVLIV